MLSAPSVEHPSPGPARPRPSVCPSLTHVRASLSCRSIFWPHARSRTTCPNDHPLRVSRGRLMACNPVGLGWADAGSSPAPPRAGCVSSGETLSRPCKMGSVARESQGPEKSQQGCVHHTSGTYPALVADRRPLPASRSRARLRGRLSALLPPSCPGLSAQSARGRAAQGAAWCGARRQRPTPGAELWGCAQPRGQGAEHQRQSGGAVSVGERLAGGLQPPQPQRA